MLMYMGWLIVNADPRLAVPLPKRAKQTDLLQVSPSENKKKA